ncbi:hypothetical protein CC1G_09410 [Coprinopsis cinerea okayama7|uniref:Nudix hydrolase domain-containing protein n=1 Tax=Coprinopsis cinerea (strain Okayama-7 / 130 / ATCC MYA-4618 / FGSC 9003) TaxID=240176 RepID=A8NIH4_COPC7|nr:hypothetical protein CC1G_09410 [Coprinopsis cinerea okayama7\|eukprot:XP_001833996.2 hypothetical protein CC1G_09410 [Coprinopsis cinerea okayama7\
MSNKSDDEGLASSVARALGLNRSQTQSGSSNRTHARRPTSLVPPRQPPLPKLSEWSTPAVPDSVWSSMDFMLGVGMVIIQENTHKIVVVYEKEKKYCFFPRGRKDVGESLEQAALREAYEESGYRASFMPHWAPHLAPFPPSDPEANYRATTEAIAITLLHWSPRTRRVGTRLVEKPGGEYLIHWYLGMIPEDMDREVGTGMPDEQNFESHLLPVDEAIKVLPGQEAKVLQFAWAVYRRTLEINQQIREEEVKQASSAAPTLDDDTGAIRGSTNDDARPNL